MVQLSRPPTLSSLFTRMMEAQRLGRNEFLQRYAGGQGARRHYVRVGGVDYDLKAIWAASHRPPILPATTHTHRVTAELSAFAERHGINVELRDDIARPRGLDRPIDPATSGSATCPRPATPRRTSHRHFAPTGYWLFLAAQQRWDPDAWLASGPTELLYLVSTDDAPGMRAGDLGLIRANRRNGVAGGVYAVVEVLAAPSLQPEPDPRFFANAAEGAPRTRAPLRVLSEFEAGPIPASRFPMTPEFLYIHRGVPRTTIPLPAATFEVVAAALGVDATRVNESRQAATISGVRTLERAAQHLDPVLRTRISKAIERGPIGEKVKRARGGRCQICESLGLPPVAFTKANGDPYAEAHHVVPVHRLQAGSLAAINIMVLCPNHHRQIHYGSCKLLSNDDDSWSLRLDSTDIRVGKYKGPI
ncbi:MAG TPA: HNH endonuclease signature motif containing protein [Allosphingosinicella sp.]|jgi:hypothetical protein